MGKIKVLSIFGTRPEAIKMAPVVQALEAHPGFESKVCVTAQHREMLDQVLELFEIAPDVDLNLMKPNQTLAGLTSAVFANLDPVLADIQPDWVLVQGDTATVVSAALCAYFRQIKVGHVEAGLRTGNKWRPFPEEVNRKVAGAAADLHFAPTEWSKANLLKENVPADQIVVTGNTVIDALLQVADKPFDIKKSPLAELPEDKRLVVITAHRRENHGEPLLRICSAIEQLARRYAEDVHFVYPVHPNPNVKNVVHEQLGSYANISLLPPLDYYPFVHLIKRATVMLTDSGGIQEEAPGLGVPVLVLRKVTERPEGVEAGTVKLLGNDPDLIVSETSKLLDDPEAHAAMALAVNPYGDGQASSRILQAILDWKDIDG